MQHDAIGTGHLAGSVSQEAAVKAAHSLEASDSHELACLLPHVPPPWFRHLGKCETLRPLPQVQDNPSRGAAELTDAADEAGASDGASPLICVFGGPRGIHCPISVTIAADG